MRNKVLLISAKANMIQQFNLNNIIMLQQLGYEVHVGTNFKDFGSMDAIENQALQDWMLQRGVVKHQLDFERGLGSIHDNIKVIKQIRAVLDKSSEWEFVHVHSPIGSILGRLAAKSKHVKTMYTAHGFHFYKGAPFRNWLFLPIEWLFGLLTDYLILINHEDFNVAKYIPVKHRYYLPSVGNDVTGAFTVSDVQRITDRKQIRAELDLSETDYLIVNIGELSVRKNQTVILKAVAKLDDTRIHIAIAGVGELEDDLRQLASSLGIEQQVHLLGYRRDTRAIHHAGDLFVFPSIREGFGLSGFEALVDGIYVIGAKNTGMQDYLIDAELGRLIAPEDVDELAHQIHVAMDLHLVAKLDQKHRDFLLRFDQANVDAQMLTIYQSMAQYVAGKKV